MSKLFILSIFLVLKTMLFKLITMIKSRKLQMSPSYSDIFLEMKWKLF